MTDVDPPPAPPSSTARRTVFLDVAAVTAVELPDDRRGPGRMVLAPGAAESLELVREGHDLVLIAPTPVSDVPELAALPVVPVVPSAFVPGSWFVTAEPSWCEGDRPAGLRTILVGPRRPPTHRPTLRCDIEARDLAAAVMEILVRETMA